jgi:hypothetical protein
MKRDELIVGQVVEFVPNSDGGFYILLARELNKRYFCRADKFPVGGVPVRSIISFQAESEPRKKGQLPRITQIIDVPNLPVAEPTTKIVDTAPLPKSVVKVAKKRKTIEQSVVR